jgi:hypothetical protein
LLLLLEDGGRAAVADGGRRRLADAAMLPSAAWRLVAASAEMALAALRRWRWLLLFEHGFYPFPELGRLASLDVLRAQIGSHHS